MREKGKAMLLSFVSKQSDNVKEAIYETEDGDEYKGKYTNDAPTKYLIKLARENNNPISVVASMVSKEVEGKAYKDFIVTLRVNFPYC